MAERGASSPAWRAGLFLFSLALLPRLAVWTRARRFPQRFITPDSVEYLDLAHQLRSTHVFANSAGAEILHRTPGYPLFLAFAMALFGGRIDAVSLLQLVLASLTPVLIYRICLLSCEDERAALAGGILSAVDANDALHSLPLVTESLFCLMLALGLLLFVQARSSKRTGLGAASGLVFSAASFLRPIALYFPLTLLPWLWRRSRGAALAMLAGAYLLPAAWMARNEKVFGRFEFCSIAQYNLLYWRAAAVESLRAGRSIDEITSEWRNELSREHPGADEAQQAGFEAQKAVPILEGNPWLDVKMTLVGAIKTMGGHASDLFNDLALGPLDSAPTTDVARLAGSGTRGLLKRRPGLWIYFLGYLAFLACVYAATLAGTVSLWRRREFVWLSLMSWGAFYFLSLSSGAESYYRFRMPVMIFLLPLAAEGVRPAFQKWSVAFEPFSKANERKRKK